MKKIYVFGLINLIATFNAQGDYLAQQKKIVEKLSLTPRYTKSELKNARQIIKEAVESLGLKVQVQEYTVAGYRENIFAVIESTNQSKEYIVIGGHYDTVRGSNGASDNASGVAVTFGIAHQLLQLAERKKNVIITFMDAEECVDTCIDGAKYFAEKLHKEELNVHSAHTIDQAGWDNDGDLAIEMEKAPDALYEIYQAVNKKDGFNIPIHRTTTYAEHDAFREYFPLTTGITEEYINGDSSPHYHTSNDKYDTVNFKYLNNVTLFLTAVIKSLVQ